MKTYNCDRCKKKIDPPNGRGCQPLLDFDRAGVKKTEYDLCVECTDGLMKAVGDYIHKKEKL